MTLTLLRIRDNQYAIQSNMIRTQNPLGLIYCMIYSKRKSLTLDRVSLYCTETPLAHEHLYVILSGVRKYDSVKLFDGKEKLHHKEKLSYKL